MTPQSLNTQGDFGAAALEKSYRPRRLRARVVSVASSSRTRPITGGLAVPVPAREANGAFGVSLPPPRHFLRGPQGTARDIQASGQCPGSAEVTLTCKVVDVAPKGIATESPAPTNCARALPRARTGLQGVGADHAQSRRMGTALRAHYFAQKKAPELVTRRPS